MRSFPRGNPRTTSPRKDLSESPGIPLRITVGLLRVFGNEDSGLQFVKQYLFVHFDSSSDQFPYPQPLFPLTWVEKAKTRLDSHVAVASWHLLAWLPRAFPYRHRWFVKISMGDHVSLR
jgi:hypothetical protein